MTDVLLLQNHYFQNHSAASFRKVRAVKCCHSFDHAVYILYAKILIISNKSFKAHDYEKCSEKIAVKKIRIPMTPKVGAVEAAALQ